MTTRQYKTYWREWGYVRGYCKAKRLPEPERHALHRLALEHCHEGPEDGPCPQCARRLADPTPISSKEFDSPQQARDHFVDLIFAEFRAVHQPANLDAQVRQLQQPRKRAEWPFPKDLFKCLAVYVGRPEAGPEAHRRDACATHVEAYVASICMDKFKTPFWKDLSDVQLEHLKYTLSRCLNGANGLRNKAGDSLHDMKLKAGVRCACSQCGRSSASHQSGGAGVPPVSLRPGVPPDPEPVAVEDNVPF